MIHCLLDVHAFTSPDANILRVCVCVCVWVGGVGGSILQVLLVYLGLTPQQQPGSYQGGEMMMMKSIFSGGGNRSTRRKPPAYGK